MNPSLETDLFGLKLDHPVLNASGTFDALAAGRLFGEGLRRDFPFSAYVTKTITRHPRAGNPPHRLWETPSGMINSIGLPGPGLERFLDRDLTEYARLGVPLIVSVMAETRDGFAELVEALAARPEVVAIELNVSCPNVHSGLIVGEQPAETAALMKRLRPLTAKPLIVKLTPNMAGPEEVARAAGADGADAVSLINTIRAAAVDPAVPEPWLGAGTGGLSGPAVRPVALAQVRAVAAAVSIPVIGMGGITDGESALDFILCGAAAVAVGTASFIDPAAGETVRRELSAALERRGYGSIGEARASTSS